MALRFRLRFDPSQIEFWAMRFPLGSTEQRIEREIAPRVRSQGFYNFADFMTVCDWNTSRTRQQRRQNHPEIVETATRIALLSPDDGERAEVLLELHGVGWQTASALLHWGFNDLYPVLDHRALWSVGISPVPAYNLPMWLEYAGYCRVLAHGHGVSMRVLDRALWQFARENQ